MENTDLGLCKFPAGSNQLVCELYSEHHMEETQKSQLKHLLHEGLKQGTKVLIFGGRCGLTAEILLPKVKRIDIIEEEPYCTILRQRFNQSKDISYFFGKQGYISEGDVLVAPICQGKEIHIHSTAQFQASKFDSYDLVVLQNVLKTVKEDILQDLMRIKHSTLLTMLVPGRIKSPKVFEFLATMQRSILIPYYDNFGYKRLLCARMITGRRKELEFREVYLWQRKQLTHEEDEKAYEVAKGILDKEHVNETFLAETKPTQNPYETQEMVNMYVEFHYGLEEHFGIPNYPLVCAQKAIDLAKKKGVTGRALDIGCATGRFSIEMAKYFTEVGGIDLSVALIKAANQILENSTKTQTVHFKVGDACKLDHSLGKFNLIFAGNLIDRLKDPTAFLEQVSEFLLPNGLLINSSPYSWLSEFTPQEKWIGGYYKDNTPVTTQQGLRRILSGKGLQEVQPSEDIRFVIKENEWVFQYTLANMTFWAKTQ